MNQLIGIDGPYFWGMYWILTTGAVLTIATGFIYWTWKKTK